MKKYTDKKIIITGSSGFIFSNFIRKAFKDKYPATFISIDRVNNSSIHSMYRNKDHTFYIADIRDQHIIDKIFQFEQPDLIIHGAAESAVDASIIDPNSFVSSNILGTQNIINACVKHEVKKLLMVSTDEVYGQLLHEDDKPWTEDSPINPRNPYSASKMAAELMVKAAHETYGLTYNITRSCNNYGPRQTTDKLIPRVIKCIIDNKPIPIYGQGSQIRDWMHVSDNCDGIWTVLEKGKDNEIYNISSNQELSNIEVVNKICNVMGKGHELMTFIDDPRKSHDFRYSINSSKLRELGWKTNIKFSDGLEMCCNWFINNLWSLK